MKKEGKIAVIGDRDSVLAFKSIGADVYCSDNSFEIKETIRKLAHDGCLIIYITEPLAALVSDVIEKYRTSPYPAIIPIPDAAGTNGFGITGLKKDLERAIGADILFNKEGK